MPAYWNFTIHKNWLGAGGTGWANKHEALSEADLPVEDADLQALALALVEAERAIHVPSVWFDRVVISTWDPDGDPYAPETFRSIPLGLLGTRNITSVDRIDLNGVLKVRKGTAYGRNGKLSYRGVLVETDVNATASGFWDLVPTSSIAQTGVDWQEYESNITPYLGNQGAPIYLAVIGITGGDTPSIEPRPVTSMKSYGAGFNRMDHKHYNRAGKGPL